MRKILLLMCLTAFCWNAQAQKTADTQLGNWYMYNGSHQLSDKVSLKSMAHFRFYELADEHQQTIYRLGVNYAFNSYSNFTVGLSHVTTNIVYDGIPNYVDEFRIYEDFFLKSKWGKFTGKHRFRMEHRFISSILGNKTLHWIRYDLNVSYPISKSLSVYIFNETFFNFQGDLFDQNWTGVGLVYKMTKNIKWKLGYLHISNSVLGFDRLQMGIILNTGYRKK